MPSASWVVLKVKWNNELSDTLYMKGLRICRILICSQSHDLSLSHYLSFRFRFCGLFCLLSSGFSHLSHRKSWSDSAVIQRTAICGLVLFLLRQMAFLTILSLSKIESTKQVLSTWMLALLQGSCLLWWK